MSTATGIAGSAAKRSATQSSAANKEVAQQQLPPHDTETERALLSACLADPDLVPRVYSLIRDRYKIFWEPAHRLVYKAIIELWQQGVQPDIVSVYNRIKTYRDSYGRSGADLVSAQALAEIANAPASSANVEYYHDILRARYLCRQLIAYGKRLEELAMAWTDDTPPDELYSRAVSELSTIRDESNTVDYVPITQTLREIDEDLGRVMNGDVIMGATTGYSDLDRIIGGLRAPDMIIVAARPSVGKTAMALNIAMNAIERNGNDFSVGIFSLEMSRKDIVTRMLCSMARVDTRFTRGGTITKDEVNRLASCAMRMAMYRDRIVIDDRSGISIGELCASARIMAMRFNIKLLVIDYLQLLHSSRKHANRNEEVAHISHQIKALAKELNIPIILISQLNRNAARSDYPSIADLRDSGVVEEDADIIALLRKEDSQEPIVGLEMIIAKNRNGPTDTVPFVFFRTCQRIELQTKTANV